MASPSQSGPDPIGPARFRAGAIGDRGAAGTSSIASVFGVAIFLGFLMLSTQVLVHLYAASTVTAVAFDTARRASGLDGGCTGAERDARARLGTWGSDADVTVRCTTDTGDGRTEVVVSGPSPARGLQIFGGRVVDRIERGASFRREIDHRSEDGA